VANPPVEDVLQQVKDAITQGTGLPLEANALDIVEPRYHDSFQAKLQTPGTWDRDGANVLNAARQLGIIATSIASLNQKATISQSAVVAAADIVRTQCHIGFQEGQWCP
jgi:hypothetical protein